jgi:hypothetical protein
MKMVNYFVAQCSQPRRTHCTVSAVARCTPRTSSILLIHLSHVSDSLQNLGRH